MKATGRRGGHSVWLRRAHGLYKAVLSPLLHSAGLGASGCRFQPTCSEYATLAIAEHGAVRGLWLGLWRLLRCHPLSRGGWDPVPSAGLEKPETAQAGTIE
jgi:putative membrane protein insertion efficiency factor